MILLISDKPSIWVKNLNKHLLAANEKSIILSMRDVFQSGWSIDYINDSLRVVFSSHLIEQKNYCKAIIISYADFNFTFAKISKQDMVYYKYAWLSLFSSFEYLDLPIYNQIDLCGNRDNWREIYSLVASKGFDPIVKEKDYWQLDFSISINDSWHNLNSMEHYSAVHSKFANTLGLSSGIWVYVHYLDLNVYYISKYFKGVALVYELSEKYIKLGWDLLEHCKCRLGTVLFYIDKKTSFVGLSAELNWHYCWQNADVVNQAFAQIIANQQTQPEFELIKGAKNEARTMTISKKLRPDLVGGWVS